MSATIFYLLKVSITTAGFYALFYFLFRSEKQFKFNRFYLLFILAVGFLIPLIVLKLPGKAASDPLLPPLVKTSDPVTSADITTHSHDIVGLLESAIFYVYCVLVSFFILRLIFSYLAAYRIIRNGSCQKLGNRDVIVTEKNLTPFSFFNKIVIPENLLSSPDLAVILQHENVHSFQWHTLDLMIAELAYIFQWFNPFAWLLKNAVRLNLEYLADSKVITEFPDIESYQMALVRLTDIKPLTSLVNSFHVSQLKKRIIMMKKKNFSRFPVLKKLAILPMALVMLLLVSEKQYSESGDNDIVIKGKVTSADDHTPLNTATVSIKDKRIGTVTDKNGYYALRVNKNDKVLVFSMMGYETREITLNNKTTVDVALKKGNENAQGKSKNDLNPDEVWIVTGETDSVTGTIRIIGKKADNKGNITVKGKVISSLDEKPLPSINVIIKGKPVGTITDSNGDYILKVKKEDKTLSFIDSDGNYKGKDININESVNLNTNVEVEVPVELNVELDPRK